MTRALLASIVLALSATGAVVGATEMADNIAPTVATVTSDASLKAMYTKTVELEGMHGYTHEQALQEVAAAFTNETVIYSVEDGSLVARTDWSCRKLVIGPVAITVTDC